MTPINLAAERRKRSAQVRPETLMQVEPHAGRVEISFEFVDGTKATAFLTVGQAQEFADLISETALDAAALEIAGRA